MDSANCGKTRDSCRCQFLLDHAGPHICECEGSWDAEGNILELPLTAVSDRYVPLGTRFSPLAEVTKKDFFAELRGAWTEDRGGSADA